MSLTSILSPKLANGSLSTDTGDGVDAIVGPDTGVLFVSKSNGLGPDDVFDVVVVLLLFLGSKNWTVDATTSVTYTLLPSLFS